MWTLVDVLVQSVFDWHICSHRFGKWMIARLLDIACAACLVLIVFGFFRKMYLLAVAGIVGEAWFSVLDWRFFLHCLREKQERQDKEKPLDAYIQP